MKIVYHALPQKMLFTLHIINHELSFPSTGLQITRLPSLHNGNKNYGAWKKGFAMQSCNEMQDKLDSQQNFR